MNTRPKPSRENSKSCGSMSDVKGLRWFHSLIFGDYNTVFFLGFLYSLSIDLFNKYLMGLVSHHLRVFNAVQALLS